MIEQNNGGYDAEGVIWHAYSPRLMKKIIELFPKEIPVVDLGCGLNNYVNILCYLGYKARGFDFTDLGSKNFVKADLTIGLLFGFHEKCNVISLEVGEHIPKEKCGTYLDNITAIYLPKEYRGDIIMSWAIPGQEGVGHINCQSNEWVIVEMHKRGYKLHGDKTSELRESIRVCHCTWFRETLMYFTPA